MKFMMASEKNASSKRAASSTQLTAWIDKVRPRHERLTDAVQALLVSLLKTAGVEYLSIDGRTKNQDSIVEKCARKSYNSPEQQLTDISGIRIVTFLESQVLQITEIVRANFAVDETNSLDRAETLGSDRIGYRSSHFVCALGTMRSQLPEYAELHDLKFEIQVRTVLQHAWAELAHDRSFKLGLELPSKIQRRLNLHAGMLEIVDAAFDEIARDIDKYRQDLRDQPKGQIAITEINSISVENYLEEISNTYGLKLYKIQIPSDVIEELKAFGLKKIGDLSALFTPKILIEIGDLAKNTTGSGILRDIMMFTDIDRYFKTGPNWGMTELASAKALATKYGAEKIAELFTSNSIWIQLPDETALTDYDEMISALE